MEVWWLLFRKCKREFALAFSAEQKYKSGDWGADGAAGAGIRTGLTGSTESTGATGSWLLRVPHWPPLTFIYLLNNIY